MTTGCTLKAGEWEYHSLNLPSNLTDQVYENKRHDSRSLFHGNTDNEVVDNATGFVQVHLGVDGR